MTKEFDTSFELVCDRTLRHGERAWVSYQVPAGSTKLWLSTVVNASTFLDDNGSERVERDRDHVWLVHDLRVGGRSELTLLPFATLIAFNERTIPAAPGQLIEMLVEYVGKWLRPAKFRCRVRCAFARPQLSPGREGTAAQVVSI